MVIIVGAPAVELLYNGLGVIDPVMENTVDNPYETLSDSVQVPKRQFAIVELAVHEDPFDTLPNEIPYP